MRPASASEENVVRESVLALIFSRQRDTLNKQASPSCSQAVGKECRIAHNA